MNNKNQEDINKKSVEVSRRLNDGALLELLYDEKVKKTSFAIYRNSRVDVVAEYEDEQDEVLIPVSPTNNLIRHGAMVFAEEPAAYGTISDLLEEIDKYLYRYVDLTDSFRRLASYYILLTWVYDAFNELPYLRLRGDYGSGKTRALFVIGSLCQKAFFASGASSVSPIFHTLDTFRGTLILDESDFRFSDEKSELVKILNNGNVRGFPVLRTAITMKKEFDPRAFNVFGPKVVAMRRAFEDQALESRFLTEEMGQRTLRSDIPINLPDIQREEARALRNKLLMYRFENLGSIKIDESLRDTKLSPRLNQILMPLLSIVTEPELQTDVRSLVQTFDQLLYSERSTSSEAGVLEVLKDLFTESDRTSIQLHEVATEFAKRFSDEYDRPITARFIGGIIRKRLRLLTTKSHGVYVVPRSESEKVKELCTKYGA